MARINRVYADINCPFCFIFNEWLIEKGLEDTIEWIGVEHEPYLTIQLAQTDDYKEIYNTELASAISRSEGIKVIPPAIRYPSKLSLMAIELTKSDDPTNLVKVRREIYRALWQRSMDISDKDIIKEILSINSNVDISKIDTHRKTVDRNTKLWFDLGHDRIPMSLSNTGEKYLGLGTKVALESFLSTGMFTGESNEACFNSKHHNLESSQENLLIRNMLEYTLEPIFLVDQNKEIQICNNSAVSLCNARAKKDIIGKKLTDFFENFPKVVNESQIVISVETNSVTKHWEIWSNPIKENGQEYSILSWRDITELRNSNIQLKDKNEDLSNLDKEKDQFMAMLSHELRTPLNCIIGFIDLLGQSELDEEQKEIIERVANSGQNLLTLINDFLEFSKIRNGEVQLDNTPTNLNIEIQKVIDSTYILAKENECNIIFNNISENASHVKVDPLRLGQILFNLIGNAIKFSSQDNIKVTCELDSNAHYLFSIKDNGIGIPTEAQDNIFNPFIQANKNISRKYGGTGLGLAVSKGLVENFGGRIWLESSEEAGTTFYFKLPLERLSNYDIADTNKGMISEDIYMSKEHPLNILLVEDNKTNQLLFKRYLEKLGYIIDIAEDGKKAIKMVEENNYNMVFMDLYMPNMDGIEATKEIRKNFDKDSLPIYALTANNVTKIKEECFKVGMNDFLTKPVHLNKIKKTIFKYLEKAR